MVNYSYQVIALFFLIVLVGGCERACLPVKQAPVAMESKAEVVSFSKFHLNPQTIFDKTKNFSYRSELNITLSRNGETSENKELIEALGDNERIMLKKRIDSYHFFELFSEKFDLFILKNQNGVWRLGRDNKQMYQALVLDGLNAVAWLVDEFSLRDTMLKNFVDKGLVTTYYVRDAQVLSDTPFYVNTLTPILAFFTIERSQVDCEVSLDKKLEIPVFARCDASIIGANDTWIKINATMTLETRGLAQAIEPPQVQDDEPAVVPVNIGPRFKELLGLDSNNG